MLLVQLDPHNAHSVGLHHDAGCQPCRAHVSYCTGNAGAVCSDLSGECGRTQESSKTQVMKGVTTEKAEKMQRRPREEIRRYKSGYKPFWVERHSHTVCWWHPPARITGNAWKLQSFIVSHTFRRTCLSIFGNEGKGIMQLSHFARWNQSALCFTITELCFNASIDCL